MPLFQTRLRFSQPNDRFERQADSAAQSVTRNQGARSASALSRPVTAAGGGQDLPSPLRSFFESQFGSDLSRVRIHADEQAARAAEGLHARAFTTGNDITFGRGEFAPQTAGGMRLLAHELMHTIQQRSTPAPIIQRQPAQPGASITAQDLFPFPKGSRILLGNALPELISRILSIAQPATVAALNAINNQVATVLTSTPDLFEARVAGPITIPAVAGQDARTIRDIILSLRRTNNTFEFSLTGIEDKQTVRSSLIPPEAFGQMRGLTASREGGGIVLSRPADTGTEPLLDVTRGESGEIILRAFTEALTGQKISPERVEVISLTSLPDAQTKAEADRAVSKIIERQEKRRQTPRQELSFGLGGQFADRNAFLLTTSWQIRFPSTRLLGPLGLKPLTREIVGQLLQFPLELQIQYAPGASVLGSVSTGPALRIPKSVPINLRLVAGVAGGRAAEGGGNATVFGPTVGAAAGFELGRWRVNVRFERLLNIVGSGQDVTSLFFTLGRPL